MGIIINSKILQYEDFNPIYTVSKDIDGVLPYDIKLPDHPKPEDIKNFGLKRENQFFVKERKHKDLDKLIEQGKIEFTNQNKTEQRDNPLNKILIKLARKNKELAEWIEGQWEKRLHGEWQYIYGKPIFIPGIAWFYLNYYTMDIGNPDFRMSDIDFWLWWEFEVVKKNSVFGGINFTRRRVGKTYRMGNILLEGTTRKKNILSGMQSKTDIDAKAVWDKAIIPAWKSLPFYFSPTFANSSNPKSQLEFRNPTISGRSITIGDEPDELYSFLGYRSSTETAYDGAKLYRYGMDEAGKTDKSDIFETWDKVKPTFLKDDLVFGKGLVTTTVEEMESKGGANFKKLWEKSSRDDIKALGRTESGLVRYFEPAYSNFIFDQYGFAIVDDPLDYQMEYRRKKIEKLVADGDIDSDELKLKNWEKGGREILTDIRDSIKDSFDRQKEIRKFPFTVKEAFRSMSVSCPFTAEIIQKRLDYFLFNEERDLVRGDFVWKDDKPFTEVFWRPQKNGGWLMKGLSELVSQSESNKYSLDADKKHPVNTDKFVGGADPFRYRNVTGEKQSEGTAHFWAYYDPHVDAGKHEDEWITDNFFLEYGKRPPTPDMYADDLLKACIYLSCKIYPEVNVAIVWEYFMNNGYEKYLLHEKEYKMVKGRVIQKERTTPGESTVGSAKIERMIASTDTYIETRGYKCPFPNFLNDCLALDPNDLSPYDYFVSGSKALVAKGLPMKKQKQNSKGMSSFYKAK